MKVTTSAKIKKEARVLSNLLSKIRKQFFLIEVMQSDWEARNKKGKVFTSADDYIEYINKKIVS